MDGETSILYLTNYKDKNVVKVWMRSALRCWCSFLKRLNPEVGIGKISRQTKIANPKPKPMELPFREYLPSGFNQII